MGATLRQSAANPTVGQWELDHPDYGKWFCIPCNTQHDVPVECPNAPREQRSNGFGSFNNDHDPRYVGDPRAEQERIHREVTT